MNSTGFKSDRLLAKTSADGFTVLAEQSPFVEEGTFAGFRETEPFHLESLAPYQSGAEHLGAFGGAWLGGAALGKFGEYGVKFESINPTGIGRSQGGAINPTIVKPGHNQDDLVKDIIADSNKQFPMTETNALKAMNEFAPEGFSLSKIAGSGAEGKGADLMFTGPNGEVFLIENKSTRSFGGFQDLLSYAAQEQATGHLVFIQVPEGTNAVNWMGKFWGSRIKDGVLDDIEKMNAYKTTEVVIVDPNGTVLLPRSPIYNP